MPRIPGVESLGQSSFEDRGSVVTPSINMSGQNRLIATVDAIATRQTERLDATSLYKAKMHYQKAKLEADSAFDSDPDFETYQKRYEEKISEAEKVALEMVRNPSDRELFQEDLALHRTQGVLNITAKAFSKEADKGLADLDETLTIARENYLRATSKQDKDFAVNAINDAINSAEQATYLDKDKAQSLRQKAAVDMAIASIEAAPAEKKLQLLKSREGIFDKIPSDTRAKMIDAYQGQYDAQAALGIADSIRNEGGTLTERAEKVNKISDAKVRAAARSQVINDYNLEETEKGKARYNIYDEAAKGVTAAAMGQPGGMGLNEFIANKPKEWAALEAKEQSALIAMTGKGKPKETEFLAYHEVNTLKKSNKEEAYRYFLKNVSRFSLTDAKKIDDELSGLAEEPKPLLGMREAFQSKASELGVKKEDAELYGKAEYRIQEEYDTWAKANPGKQMTFREQTELVNSVFDVAVEGWFSIDKRAFEVPRSEADSLKLQKKADEYKAKYGYPPSDEVMTLIAKKMTKDGLIGQ